MAVVDEPVLRLSGVGKHYGGVRALSGVDLEIAQGECVALVGDNGAGKSTLVRILSGAHQPSEGTIAFAGRPVRFRSPADALEAGIATTYQDLALAPHLTISQNIYMGGELLLRPHFLGLLDKARMRREARGYLDRFGFAVNDLDRPVSDLSGGQQQAVALARALRWQARVVIMDEPTAALGVGETRMVLDLIRALGAQKVTVILVSHDMDDVVAVTQRIIVLKRGRKVGEVATARVSPSTLAHTIMTGEIPPEASA